MRGAGAAAEFEDIPRSATRRSEERGTESRPLAAWAHLDAFVLLAEPGGGKSCAFKFEQRAQGGAYVKARAFAILGPPDGYSGEILFIDGLDEMRADDGSRNGPLDAVISRLNDLGRPRFRLSCREADWLAAVDHEALREVAPGKQLEALYLDPLNDKEVLELLRRRSDRVPDSKKFCQEAAVRGLDGLLHNPLLLGLLVDAVGDDWPSGRADVYRLACDGMAVEHDPKIRAARAPAKRPLDQQLHDAGLLSSVLLLAGLDAWVIGPTPETKVEAPIQTLPTALGVIDANAALSSKLFLAEGQRRIPRHRSIAEYLAACVIGQLVTLRKLPMSRVLAMMSDIDGGIVEPLRGLLAWLPVTCPGYRSALIDRDPLACVLYGDVRAFGRDDKCRLLEGLRREADRFVWFRSGNWAAHPFGALGTADMASEFAAQLGNADRSLSHQSLLECVLDAIRHGDAFPQLLPELESVIRDPTYTEGVRESALDTWLAQSSANLSRAIVLLNDIHNGVIDDPRDELCSRLLEETYPVLLPASEVFKHYHGSKARQSVGRHWRFWTMQLLERTTEEFRPVLADALHSIGIRGGDLHSDHDLLRLVSRVVTAALEASGPYEPVERISRWLSISVDEQGFGVVDDATDGIRDWLGRHPAVQRAVVAYEMAHVRTDPHTGRFHFWVCEEKLHHASRPRDWYVWLLRQAAKVGSPGLAEYCLRESAHAAINPSPGFDIDMVDVESWVEAHRLRWPQVDDWLEQSWLCRLDDWRGDHHRRQQRYQVERATDRLKRRQGLEKHLDEMARGRASPPCMHNLAHVYLGHFSEFHGETPEDRVSDYLAGDAAEATRVIAGLRATLSRTDLPTVAEILAADIEQRPHYLRAACLLGAQLAQADDLNAPLGWTDEVVRRVVAFYLTEGTSAGAACYNQLAEQRPHLVADVLGVYARQCLLQRAGHSITGLWPLAREDAQGELARIVVPPLLREFPVRARPAQLRRLNAELLPAAVRHLDSDEFKAIINERLAMECLDSGQRIAWLLVGLRFAAHQRSRLLHDLVSRSRVRALRLGSTLITQSEHAMAQPKLPAAALSRLIEMLAPHTTPEFPHGVVWVGEIHRLRDVVRGLIDQLAAVGDQAATEEIERLRDLPALHAWKITFDATRHEHVRAIRNARFLHATVESAGHALAGQAPANALDLAALVCQHLQDFQARVRDDEANSLRLFWRDPTTKGCLPRIENQCRDVLFRELRDRLSGQNVLLHKEALHANDTRADLRAETMVAGQEKVVPIEIKKENHPHLWTAWRDQLEYRYMTHPAAEGVGLYLVLWFGYRPVGDAQGDIPTNAQELEQRLTALVPPSDRVRLRVWVLDLSMARAEGARKPKALRRSRKKR